MAQTSYSWKVMCFIYSQILIVKIYFHFLIFISEQECLVIIF